MQACLQQIDEGYQIKGTLEDNLFVNLTHNEYTNPIGRGTYGIIFKGTMSDGSTVVIKQAAKSSNVPIIKIRNEAKLMRSIKSWNEHDNLIFCHFWNEDPNYIFTIMPLFRNGTLDDIIKNNQIKSEHHALEYFRQICYGVMRLHNQSYVHVDLKCENVFISENTDQSYKYDYILTVADLGDARILSNVISTQGGTPLTSAPETENGKYSFKSDVFSLGCIYYKMITGNNPFNGNNFEDLKKEKLKEEISVLSRWNNGKISKISLAILERCLQSDPINRISNDDLFRLLDIDNLYKKYQDYLGGATLTEMPTIKMMTKYEEVKITPEPIYLVPLPTQQELNNSPLENALSYLSKMKEKNSIEFPCKSGKAVPIADYSIDCIDDNIVYVVGLVLLASMNIDVDEARKKEIAIKHSNSYDEISLYIAEKCIKKNKNERIKIKELHQMLSLLFELSTTRRINTDRKIY